MKYHIATPLGLLVLLAVTGGSATLDRGNQKTTVRISPQTVCLYGHWIEGDKTLELRDGRVYLDGIRVYPPVPIYRPVPNAAPSANPFDDLLQRWGKREQALRAAGNSRESVIADGRAYFLASDLVDSVDFDTDSTCIIYGGSNEAYLVRLWSHAPLPRRDKSEDTTNRGTSIYCHLLDYIDAGDLLVFNDTRVFPARLFGRKESGGKIEVLVERILDSQRILAHIHCRDNFQSRRVRTRTGHVILSQ